MKKLFISRILILLASLFLWSGCAKDDENIVQDNQYDNTRILGSWHEISITEGEYISGVIDCVWTFNSDNTATERIIQSINGVITKDKTVSFLYKYKENTIELTDMTGMRTVYSINVSGNMLKMGNIEHGYFNLINMESEEPYTCIKYKTTDNKPIEIAKPGNFKELLITNEYKNGEGIIRFAKELKEMPESAFAWCESLTEITIPKSVTIIREYAFYNCI